MGFEGFSFSKKRFFAMTGDSGSSVLVEVMKAAGGAPVLRLVARTEGSVNSEKTAAEIMAAAKGSVRGEVSIALPLNCFEIVTLTLPVMAEDAVRKALPYHLAKAIDKPLQDCVYDWQITQRQKNQVQVTVYLFPAKSFHRLQQEFYKRQLTVKYLEADIFAALALLDQKGRLNPAEAVLCALIWPDSLSFGVYENKSLTLARSVDLKQPATPFAAQPGPAPPDAPPGETILNLEEPAAEPTPPAEPARIAETVQEAPTPAGSLETLTQAENAGTDILAGFDLLSPVAHGLEEAKAEPAAPPPPKPGAWEALTAPAGLKMQDAAANWPGYLQSINLEIMRTKDYYASVVKGGTIKQMVVAGAEPFWEQLAELARNSLGVELEQLQPPSMMPGIAPLLNTICLGTGMR